MGRTKGDSGMDWGGAWNPSGGQKSETAGVLGFWDDMPWKTMTEL